MLTEPVSESKDHICVNAEDNQHLHSSKSTYGKRTANTSLIDTTACKHNFSNIPVHAPMPLIQTKLSVSKPGDEYEQQADAMADQVMQMPENRSIKPLPPANHISPVIQTKSKTPTVNASLTDSILLSSGKGNSMDNNTQSFMSDRFGFNFRNVKIHSDNEAALMNQKLNARAFTFGDDIYFNEGEYNPVTGPGKYLLAHELTHVIQQSGVGKRISRKENEEDDSTVSLGLLDNSLVGKGAEEIVGQTQWLVLKEFLRGLAAGVKFMPPEQKSRIEKKFKEQGFVDTVKYAGGYALGIIEGIGSSIYSLAEAIITLIKLPYEINRFLIVNVPELAKKYGPRIQAFLSEGGGLEQQLRNAVNKFMQNPRQNLNQIKAMMDAAGNLALSKVRELGHGVAAKTLAFLEEPWFQFGRDIGKIVGQIIFEVILAVASDAIANVVKEALAVAGRLAARVITGTVELIRSAGRFVTEALEWLSRLGSKITGEMGEMFESVRAFLKRIGTLMSELGEEGALADTAGGRMPIPDAKGLTLESRAAKPPVRTSPAKVSDLSPPKIHPSNVPKEAPVPKREPFANDPDFHEGFADNARQPGVKSDAYAKPDPVKTPSPAEGSPESFFDETALERDEAIAHRERGNTFNTERSGAYPHNEVYIDSPSGKGRVRLDSYDPGKAIVSRKYPRGAKLDPDRAIEYINELVEKYPPGAVISNTPQNIRAGIAGQVLRGEPVLELPVLLNEVPQEIIEFAERAGVILKDASGRVIR